MQSNDPTVRLGSGAKRSREIQARLQQCIEKGVIPPYCMNCGVIETPTWRKAYGRIFTEEFDKVRLSEKEGDPIAVDEVKKDAAGKVLEYRLIKKSLGKDEGGWQVILLCNRK